MFSTRFSRFTNPNVMRMFAILHEGKGLKKIPNKTVEYYIEDPSALTKRIYISLPHKQIKRTVDQSK